MPAWPGGDCPECGEEMPPNLVHCQICQALLNSDLVRPEIPIPEFQELRELEVGELSEDVCEVQPIKYYVGCNSCRQELKVNVRYYGQSVACKFCDAPFEMEFESGRLPLLAVETICPHCDNKIRASKEFFGHVVACKFCSGKLMIEGV